MPSAKEILKRLKINEKISLLSGSGTYETKSMIEDLPSINMFDGPHGVRKKSDPSYESNLGHKSEQSICYPSLSTSANSWDEDLLQQIGEHLGDEAQNQDVQMILGPGVNIKRNPLCGRNFEYFSEDPFLSGKLGAAWVRGLQNRGVGASVKHYCCNNQETARMSVNSIVDERTLREIYLKPFEIVVKESKPATVMSSYNRLNGIYLSDNKRLLKEILKEEWGFEGFVVTDWGAMNDRVAAIEARLALEMPDSLGYFDQNIKKALASGRISETDIDECLEPMINKILELAGNRKQNKSFEWKEHHNFCRTAAEQSAVLLKNDGTLPLNNNQTVCVIGAFAEEPRYQGTGSSKVNPHQADSLLDGLRELGILYDYRKGFELSGETPAGMLKDVIITAEKYETVLVAAGLPEEYESEGFDRENLELPPAQNELICHLCAMGKKVVVVLVAGGCVETPWADQVNAILFMGLGGEASGTACADLLFGKANPCGKLAESWPYSYTDNITNTYWLEDSKQAYYREGIYVGYRYFNSSGVNVRFPFGFGLSYAAFDYSSLQVDEADGGFIVSFDIQNTGVYGGAEIAQVYISKSAGNVHRPAQELKGFSKVFLDAGESKRLTVTLDRNVFAHYDAKRKSWQVENGEYEIKVASSSRDTRLKAMIQISFGIDYIKEDLGWYSNLKGEPGLADFEKIYGGVIQPIPPYKKGTYDSNASFAEMKKDSLFVRIMCGISERIIAKGLGIKPDYKNPDFKMLMAVSMNSPLRALTLSSPKSMNKRLVKFILMNANGFKNKKNRSGKNEK